MEIFLIKRVRVYYTLIPSQVIGVGSSGCFAIAPLARVLHLLPLKHFYSANDADRVRREDAKIFINDHKWIYHGALEMADLKVILD